jgi:pSer/pThr/pTyr-binding forkhead associated (FHA) protein
VFQRNIRSRSTVIIEDLNSKKGTLVNGVQIRGEKTTLSKDVNEVQLGTCQKLLMYGSALASLQGFR